jgi:O-antigen biosynthesis protein
VMQKESGDALRLTLIVPTLDRERMFGGVATGVEIFLECGKRVGAQLRIMLDEFDQKIDRAFVEKSGRRAGVDPGSIVISQRSAEAQPIEVGRNDVFIAYNCWAALNLAPVIAQQQETFGGERRPLIYLIQEYEPGFYAFSSTHMFARAAFDMKDRVWGVFNSSQLHAYFRTQQHAFEREWIFEPRLATGLRPFLEAGPASKEKQILIYGRPQIARNCYPAIVAGLRDWSGRYPQFADWSLASVGLRHRPTQIGAGRELRSLGKLSIEEYARVLRTSAIGLSLIASPHPSYPPLEMAHFGIKTLTNRYGCKDLSSVHDNIISLPDIASRTIADALADACVRFEAAPQAGWVGRSHMPAYLEQGPHPFLTQIAAELAALAA